MDGKQELERLHLHFGGWHADSAVLCCAVLCWVQELTEGEPLVVMGWGHVENQRLSQMLM